MYDDTLNVWTNGHHVGYLGCNEHSEMGFQYSDEWLENPIRFPISKTLPLQTETFEPGANSHIAHYYFANLLPEADSRNRICREKKLVSTMILHYFVLLVESVLAHSQFRQTSPTSLNPTTVNLTMKS